MAALDRSRLSRDEPVRLAHSLDHNELDAVRPERPHQSKAERAEEFGFTASPDGWSSDRQTGRWDIPASSSERGDGLEMRREAVHQADQIGSHGQPFGGTQRQEPAGLKEENDYEPAHAFGARIAQLRRSLGEWLSGGDRSTSSELQHLRERELGEEREAAERDRGAAGRFGEFIEQANRALGAIGRAFERLREFSSGLEHSTVEAQEIAAQQERERAAQERYRGQGMEM